jgi:hypothetical protein
LHSIDGQFINHAQLMGINDRLFLGGQYAVMMLGDYLSSQRTVIYSTLRLAELNKRYSLRPVGKERQPTDVELLSPFWNTQLSSTDSFNALFTADLLTYADLLLEHDSRVIDAADNFLNNEIHNRFQDAGLQW